MCPMDFNLKNGDHELIMDDCKVDYEMVMKCKEGFVLKGVEKFSCIDGNWNRNPKQTKCESKWSNLMYNT